MSVITTLITRTATIHATDSLVTQLQPDGKRKVLKSEETKIVRVDHFRGAMSYWGLAEIDGRWSTLKWLRDQAGRAGKFDSPQAFAEAMAAELNDELAKIRFMRAVDAGIGIHFSAYERFELRWIPEFFAVTNWLNPEYVELSPAGVGVTRETHHWLFDQIPNAADADKDRRLKVWQAFQDGAWLRFNNGDPRLYNLAANVIFQMADELKARGILRQTDDVETLRSLTRRPVEVVSEIQRDFCAPDTRVVGGKVHDLVVTPSGHYSSTSGDA